MNIKKRRPGRYRWNISFHKERKISFLQIAIAGFVIAIIVVFFVWPERRILLGGTLSMISLIMVFRVWAMRERKAKGE